MYYDHVSMLLILVLDFIFNSMVFPPTQLIASFIITFVYMIVNITVSTLRGIPVYAAQPWTSWLDYVKAAGTILAVPFIFFLFSLFTRLKYNLYSRQQKYQKGNEE